MKTKQEQIFSSKTLTYFMQLTETMSYTQSAQLLGITQPALTQQIKKLERSVGAPLFYSVGKKLHLSDAGRTMLAATREIYEVLNKAMDEIQRESNAKTGTIKIGLLSSIEDSAFVDFISEYYRRNREVQVVLLNMTRHEIWEHLENNEIDLAIMYLPDETIKNWKPYQTRPIFREELVFLHQGAEHTAGKPVTMADVAGAKWVTYPNSYFLSQLLRETFKNQLTDLPESVAEFTTPIQIIQFLNQTDASTALPLSFYLAHKDQIKAQATKFEPTVSFDLAFVYRKGKDEIARIEQFLGAFDDYLGQSDYLSRVAENRVKL